MDEKTALTALSQDLAGCRFSCSCGRTHAVEVRRILVKGGQMAELLGSVKAALETVKGDRVLMISDTNTRPAWGEDIAAALEDAGIDFREKCFKPAHETLLPDERALGELLVSVDEDTGLLLAVGSGSLNDLAKLVATRCGIPYIIAATAASMDGYVSSVASPIIAGLKTTYAAVPPIAVHADPEILCAAPVTLLQAGFGDILGKITALADWKLAHAVNDEYLCPTLVGMVDRAIGICTNEAQGVLRRETIAVEAVFDALVLSGLAMGMAGNSRPASGAEHHLAHYWEMEALKSGSKHALHGHAVGVGTLVVSRIYELMSERLPEGFEIPYSGRVRRCLTLAGAPVSPEAIGVSRGTFQESLLMAMHVRPRYTILRFANDLGMLPGIAEALTDEFYP